MANIIEKVINILVNDKEAKQGLDSINSSLEKVEASQTRVTQSTNNSSKATQNHTKSLKDNGGAMGLLNELTGGLAMTFKDAAEATELAGGSLKGLRGAIIATGIGALVIIVGELIANWDKWTGLIDGSTAALEANAAAVDEVNKARERNSIQLQYEIDLAEAQGKSLREVETLKLKKIAEEIKANQKLIESEKEVIRIQRERFFPDSDKIKEAYDNIAKLENTNRELYLNAKVLEAQTDKKVADDRIANGKRVAEEQAKQDKLFLDLRKKLIREIENLEDTSELLKLKRQKLRDEEEIRNLKLSYSQKEELLRLHHEKWKGIEKDFNDKRQQEANEFVLMLEEATRQANERELNQQKENLDRIATEVYEEGHMTVAEKEQADSERRRQMWNDDLTWFQNVGQATIQSAAMTQSAIDQLTAAGALKQKQGQAVSKALALTQIGIDSAVAFSKMMQGVESSAAGAASTAGPAAPGVYTATKIAFYASGVATILANIAKAKQLLSGGGQAGVVSGSGGGAEAQSAPPQFNIVGASSENQLAATIAGQQNKPQQAYVVGQEVTTQQALDRSIANNATFI